MTDKKKKTKKPEPFHSEGGKNRAKALTEERRKEIASMGGTAKNAKMTAAQRSESARHAAKARWG